MIRSTTRETVDKVQETAHELADQLDGKARRIVRSAQQTAGECMHKVQDNLKSLTDSASGYVGQGRRKAEALGHTVGGQVQERPISALLLAAGVGFLIGLILMRR